MRIEECKLCRHRTPIMESNVSLLSDSSEISFVSNEIIEVDHCNKCIPNMHYPDLGYIKVSCPECGFNNGSVNRGILYTYGSVDYECKRDRFGECYHKWSVCIDIEMKQKLSELISSYNAHKRSSISYAKAREEAKIREYELLLDDMGVNKEL